MCECRSCGVWKRRESQLYRVKSERERQILYINTYIWNLEKMVLMNLFYKAGITWRIDLCTQQRKERVGQTERVTDIYPIPCVK